MNCNFCIEQLDDYRDGKLTEDDSIQVKTHLENCADCMEVYKLLVLTELVISEEKNTESNPFLVTRIISKINQSEKTLNQFDKIPVYQSVLKPVLVTISIVAAIFFGVIIGREYNSPIRSTNIPVELLYINDATLESIDFLSNM
jgi:predicted anti-sigma-YlaC factor YlaD